MVLPVVCVFNGHVVETESLFWNQRLFLFVGIIRHALVIFQVVFYSLALARLGLKIVDQVMIRSKHRSFVRYFINNFEFSLRPWRSRVFFLKISCM